MRPSLFIQKYFLLLFAAVAIFLLLKIPHIAIKLSDTNIYFYNGYQIAQGQMLYKDIFFTNFPLVPYISALYFMVSGGSIEFYYFTAILESILVALLIFFISKNMSKNLLIAFFSSCLYLFSFILLATTEHQTGVFLASVFLISSFYFFEKKNFILVGIFTALALLTKAYFLPLALTFGVYMLIKKDFRNLIKFSLSAGTTALAILLPSIHYAPQEFMNDVFGYSLTRSAGLSKPEIIWFFVLHDLALVFLLLFNIFLIRKNLFFGLFSIFSIAFIFLYQDIYYLYLNFMIPLLCVSLVFAWKTIHEKMALQKMVLPTIFVILFGINIWMYLSNYATLQKIPNLSAMTQHIVENDPEYLYGTNDITPILSYLSRVPLLENITDTNTNLYRKEILNAKKLTHKAIQSKTLLIGHGVNYPQFNVQEKLIDEIFEKKLVTKYCEDSANFQVRSEGVVNEINIMKCY